MKNELIIGWLQILLIVWVMDVGQIVYDTIYLLIDVGESMDPRGSWSSAQLFVRSLAR